MERSRSTMKIGLTYDLKDDYRALGMSEDQIAEFDSHETIDALEGALRRLGFETCRIGNIFSLVKALAAGSTWDMVFNICEGLYGSRARSPGAGPAGCLPHPLHIFRSMRAEPYPAQGPGETGSTGHGNPDPGILPG